MGHPTNKKGQSPQSNSRTNSLDFRIRQILGLNFYDPVPMSFELQQTLEDFQNKNEGLDKALKQNNFEACLSRKCHTPNQQKRKIDPALTAPSPNLFGRQTNSSNTDRSLEKPSLSLKQQGEFYHMELQRITDALYYAREREKHSPNLRQRFMKELVSEIDRNLKSENSNKVRTRFTRVHYKYPSQTIYTEVSFLAIPAILETSVVKNSRPGGKYERYYIVESNGYNIKTNKWPKNNEKVWLMDNEDFNKIYRPQPKLYKYIKVNNQFERKPEWTSWHAVGVLYIDWNKSKMSMEPTYKDKEKDFWYYLGEISSTFLFAVDVFTIAGLARKVAWGAAKFITPKIIKLGASAIKHINLKKHLLNARLRTAHLNPDKVTKSKPVTALVRKKGGGNLRSSERGEDEVFSELRDELNFDPRGTFNGRQSARQAAADAVESGLSGGVAERIGADIAVGTHASSSAIRKGLGVTGAVAESAHIGPTSLLRSLENYSRGKAKTTLLPPRIHKAFDDHWKAWAKALRRSGHTDTSVRAAKDEMLQAIHSIPGLDAKQRGTMAWLLDKEIVDLGLKATDRLPLPYPNIKPL